ncbi:E3 ubiquitin-protein ligase TRIM33 [Larimichthys crocea]|uniref:Uncharacterized protein n=1 Tax=Larimichthys crocea TaxID=215358 RepID=A0ACD3QGP5_LARCR|nr:E3 ubiquitin-protein ligase TRIM33 [Larimichthys crocea]
MPVLEQKSPVTGQNHMDTCPVCHLNFHSREPKLLPCLHSFCKKCLPAPSRNLAVTELPNSQDDRATKPLNVIRCPVCRQECMEVDVMENVFVKDTVEAPSSTMERTVQLCMTCDDNTEAAGFCVNCVEYLCSTCVEAHQRVKFTRDHNIRPTTELSQKVHGVSTQRPMFCDIHKQEPLKLFCETCDLLTCRDCQLVKHKDHNYQFLEDAYKNHKQHMENVTHQLEEKKKVIEEILFQIGNLLQAKCSTSFVPQSTVRFQCRSSYWASNVDLGSLVVESVPGQQLGGVQGIPHQLPHHGQAPSGSPHSFALGAPHNTLAQLQMQVDKLNPQAHWQPQPPPPPWTWYQSVRLQRNLPGPLQGGSPSHTMPPQPGRRTVSWKPPETHQTSGAVGSAVKKRRRSSPGPVIVIKDEPDDDGGYVQANQRASLPDSTGDQPQITAQDEVLTRLQSTDDKPHGPSRPPSSPQDQSSANHVRSLEEQQHQALLEDSNEALCAVCQTGGELLCCDKCLKVFHLSCHVPSLLKSPSGEWFCSFCRDLLTTEMRYESKPDAKTVKKEPDTEGGFLPEDKQKCERLLLHLFCSDLSSDFQEPLSASVCANNRLTVKGPMKLSTVKKRLEAKQSPCYQSPAEFVSDIRLVFENYNSLSEVDTKVTVAGRKLKELFEDHLRVIFPDQTFPEIKLETAPPDSQLSSLDNISQIAKRRRTCADLDQDTAGCPGGEEAAV